MMTTLATSDELQLFKELIPPTLNSLKRCSTPGETYDEDLLSEVHKHTRARAHTRTRTHARTHAHAHAHAHTGA